MEQTTTITSLIVISYAAGKQQANVWLSDGTRAVVQIKNDGNYLPYELINVAIYAAIRDAGICSENFAARLAEVIEQGGEPQPTKIEVLTPQLDMEQHRFTYYAPASENTADIDDINATPTEEECEAAATTPIMFAIATGMAISEAAHQQAAGKAIEEYARDAARSAADELINIAFRPTIKNRQNLIKAIARVLRIEVIAARSGISVKEPQQYHADYNANDLTGTLVTAAKAVLSAHDDGRQEDEIYISQLYDDAAHTIRKAAQNIPIRHADADAVTATLDAMLEAVANL